MRFEGKTIDDAKAKACMHLEKTVQQLDIKIINEGTKGFLGIGAKPAIIDVRIKGEEESSNKEVMSNLEEKKETETVVKDPEVKNIESIDDNKENDLDITTNEDEKITEDAKFTIEEEVNKYLVELLSLMGVKDASIKFNIDEERKLVNTEIVTDETTKIIGKKGCVLDAIQVILNTTFGKTRASYWIKLDCDNYREKRLKTIENLAYRSANTVKKYKKKVILDKLNANERRIIHSVLQNDRRVETHSEGKEPDRRLIITYKRTKN